MTSLIRMLAPVPAVDWSAPAGHERAFAWLGKDYLDALNKLPLADFWYRDIANLSQEYLDALAENMNTMTKEERQELLNKDWR